jgi:hypothetical protein
VHTRTFLRGRKGVVYGANAVRSHEPRRSVDVGVFDPRRKGGSIMCFTLEEELGALLRRVPFSERQRTALERRLGWDGRRPATLAGAADEVGYTRERVRQLELRLAGQLARSRPPLPRTVAALVLITEAAPAGCDELAHALVQHQIAAQPFDPRGVLRTAALARIETDLTERSGIILTRADVELASRAAIVAQKLASSDGATSPGAVAERLGASSAKVRRLLETSDAVTWLDPAHEWLVGVGARTRATTALRKVLAVAPELALADVEQALRRPRPQLTLPRDVIRSLCTLLPWVHVYPNDFVSCAGLLAVEDELSPIEQVLAGIFRDHGPVLSFARIQRSAESRGMRGGTAAVYLSRSPIFRQTARARYTLVGV